MSVEGNKKSVKNKSKIKSKDTTVKNPIRTSKGKRRVPEIVSRDKVDLEIGYTREKWLKMSGAELGAACLDHLAEMERQRYLCSNISGRIAGMLKDCRATTVNIVGAMVEKLEATGDVVHLKTQNLQLREDLAVARRKTDRQEKEINDLRRAIIRLEGEVNALKEGCGPYVQSQVVPKDRKEDNILNKEEKQQIQQTKQSKYANADYNPYSTPGCSTDMDYVHRKEIEDDQWPHGPDTMDWAETVTPNGDETTGITNIKDDTNKKRFNTKTRANYDNNNSNNRYVQKTSRNDIKVIGNQQLIPPRNEWKMVANKRNKRVAVQNRIIPNLNQYYNTPDSGSSAVHYRLDDKD